jgi:hypothetical protein
MKTIPIQSILSTTTLALVCLISGNAVSENLASPQTTAKPHSVSIEANHPLAMAHKQLDQAREHYKKGEMDKVKTNLQAAGRWLQGHQKNKEAIELLGEIKQLQEQINHPSDEHEGAISRLWHRSSVLVVREVAHVTKRWNDSSTANETLKHLIDARMRFSYAEHDLFIDHNATKARYELDSTLAYLDKASHVATSRIREKIIALKKDIQQLPTNKTNAAEIQTIIQALKMAGVSVEQASHSVSPEIQARSKKIAKNISNLKKDIFLLEKRQQYDVVMKNLQQLDKLL